jgi:hypothetical protein
MHFSEASFLPDTKASAIIAVRPLRFCLQQLVAGDLNLRN